MKKVFVAESHPMTRQGLLTTLEAEPDLTVCGSADDGPGALASIGGAEPDLVVAEMDLPGLNGLLLAEQITESSDLPVLLLGEQDEAICAERALRAGARGYLLKHDDVEVVLEAVRKILAGGYCVTQSVMDELIAAIASAAHPVIPSPADVLSDREMELFELTGDGLSTSDIAERMGVSVKTVESYRNRAKQKLNVRSNTDLMWLAVKWLSEDRVCYSYRGCGA